MDKRTLLAIVLSVLVISGGFLLQSLLSPPTPVETAQSDRGVPGSFESSSDSASGSPSEGSGETGTSVSTAGTSVVAVQLDEPLRERTTTIETDLFIATLSNRGGEITSLKLREQIDEGAPVEMVFAGDSDVDPFFIIFGGSGDEPVDVLFEQRIRGSLGITYSREFLAPPGDDGVARPFTLVKAYTFVHESYMFELEVTIENSINEFPNLDFDGVAYTIGYGPQIGPEFETLGGRGEYRNFYTYEDGKRKNNRIRSGELQIDNRFGWAGIVGKYFAVIGIADDAEYSLTFSQPVTDSIPTTAAFMYLSRPAIRSSKNSDIYRFYVGPKTSETLRVFNRVESNPFGLADRNLDSAVDTMKVLGWLERILQEVLDALYRVVPNYGIAILLLTVLVKALLFPITRKSYQSTSKMQALNPQINEIKEKYKGDSTRMNKEMAALYKREKASPLGGCLPLLLQMPFFLVMYQVMSKHFALRGAPFVGWITDLSEPDSILSFGSVTLPILGWTDLRLLPILFVATQVLSTMTMQQPGAQSNKNMKLMTTLMPVFFFFILYNVPSGLLLYWITTNILTAGQQKLIAYFQANKPKDDEPSGDNKPRIVPQNGGKGPRGGSRPPGSTGGSGGPSQAKPGGGPTDGGSRGGGAGPGGGKKKKPN